MEQQTTSKNDQTINQQHVTLLELLDRLLDKGVMVKGEILLSVADIDLVYLNLGLLLSSVKGIEEAADSETIPAISSLPWQTAALENPALAAQATLPKVSLAETSVINRKNDRVSTISLSGENSQTMQDSSEILANTLSSAIELGSKQSLSSKTSADAENIGKGLARLVLTLIDLIRKLMEKQAIRRIDAGQLNAGEIEKVGNAFFLLDEKMEQLKETFDLQNEDLNLDLGPLGKLL